MAHEPQCETFSLTMPQRMPRMSIPVNISTHETLGVKLKKTKEEADSAKRKLTEMLQRVHKLENTATRHEKLSVLAKNNCMRLYEVKKYKIFNQTILEENRQRREMFQQQQFENTQKRRMEEEVGMDIVRTQEMNRISRTRENVINYKRSLNDELQQTHLSLYDSCRRQADSVRRCRTRLADRKKLIEDIIVDKGRENYLNKLQQEFRTIQAYKEKMAEIEDETRGQEEFSRALSKYSGDPQKKKGSVNNVTFFLTEKAASSLHKR